MIRVEQLCKSFGQVDVLRDVNAELARIEQVRELARAVSS